MTNRVVISGRVQGVGYREWLRRQAIALELAGWVRNLRDGRVEALVSGEEGAVTELVRRCHGGPSKAKVETVETATADPWSATGFEVRPTA